MDFSLLPTPVLLQLSFNSKTAIYCISFKYAMVHNLEPLYPTPSPHKKAKFPLMSHKYIN